MTPDSLRALAHYQVMFEAERFRFATMKSEPGQMPWTGLSKEAETFLHDAYENHWVIAGFEWSDWAQTPEAIRLRNDRAALEAACPEDLSKLLTTLIRGERFREGTLAGAFDEGLLLRIVMRASALLEES